MFVYDITNLETYQNLKKLYEEVKDIVDINKVCVFIVGNKSDMYVDEKISKKEVEEYTKSVNGTYRCVSALSGNGIIELFECVGKTLLLDKNNISYSEENTDDQIKSVQLNKKKEKKNKERNCC